MPPTSKPRVFRDPVHDIIDTGLHGPSARLIGALIDTPAVQRLRFVRQLGLAHLVFHGAEHSRFSHSLGVYHLARRMLDRLPALDERDRVVALCAALLHDIGHAPFSHVMERVSGTHHEAVSASLVTSPETAVHAQLAAFDPTLPDAVAAMLTGRADGAAAHVVSSQLDADRADYLLRDAHMTGIGVGRYDLERILLCLHADDTGLLVDDGARESVEGYLVARFHMYRLVYFHRVVRAAEAMLEQLFARAKLRCAQGQLAPPTHPALAAMLRGETPPPRDWLRFGDPTIWAALDAWRDADDPVIALLAGGLLDRRLYRHSDRDVSAEAGGVAADDAVVERVLDGLTHNERGLFFVDDASDVPYRPYQPGGSGRRAIRVLARSGRVVHIEQASHLARALAEATYRLRRWYFHPTIASKVRHIAGDAF